MVPVRSAPGTPTSSRRSDPSELSRVQRNHLRATLLGVTKNAVPGESPRVKGPIPLPIYIQDEIGAEEGEPQPQRVPDLEFDALKRIKNVFTDGEENLRDLKDALSTKSKAMVECPEVKRISEDRYNALYGRIRVKDFRVAGMVRTTGNLSDEDPDVEEYDMDSEDEEFLKQMKKQNKSNFCVTDSWFESIVTVLLSNGKLARVTQTTDPDVLFRSLREAYPYQSLNSKNPVSSLKDSELAKLAAYFVKKKGLWQPKHRSGTSPVNYRRQRRDSYTVFRRPPPVLEPKFLRSSSQHLSQHQQSLPPNHKVMEKKRLGYLEKEAEKRKNFLEQARKVARFHAVQGQHSRAQIASRIQQLGEAFHDCNPFPKKDKDKEDEVDPEFGNTDSFRLNWKDGKNGTGWDSTWKEKKKPKKKTSKGSKKTKEDASTSTSTSDGEDEILVVDTNGNKIPDAECAELFKQVKLKLNGKTVAVAKADEANKGKEPALPVAAAAGSLTSSPNKKPETVAVAKADGANKEKGPALPIAVAAAAASATSSAPPNKKPKLMQDTTQGKRMAAYSRALRMLEKREKTPPPTFTGRVSAFSQPGVQVPLPNLQDITDELNEWQWEENNKQ